VAGKELNGNVKDLTTFTLQLPNSFKYLENENNEEKDLDPPLILCRRFNKLHTKNSSSGVSPKKSVEKYGFRSRGFRKLGYRDRTSQENFFFLSEDVVGDLSNKYPTKNTII
jgi:hypothetical protein